MPKNRLLLHDCELAYPFLWWDSVLHLTLEHSLVAHTTPGALETWKRMAFSPHFLCDYRQIPSMGLSFLICKVGLPIVLPARFVMVLQKM